MKKNYINIADKNNNDLLFLEYNYSSFNDIYSSISVSSKNKMVTINYKDNTKKEIEIDKKIFKKLNNIIEKYDATNWDNTKKSELEFLDGDNTSIYFKYSNGFYYHISMEVYPRGKSGVFSEIKNILENL